MNDADEPDENEGHTMSEEVTQEVEVDMLRAIASDHEALTGEPVVVMSYLAVAQVMNPDGSVEMTWTAPESMSDQAMLGHAHWLLKRVDEET